MFDIEEVSSLEKNMADWYMFVYFRIMCSKVTLLLMFNRFYYYGWRGAIFVVLATFTMISQLVGIYGRDGFFTALKSPKSLTYGMLIYAMIFRLMDGVH